MTPTQERMDRIVQLAVLALCDEALKDDPEAERHFDLQMAAELAELVLEEMKQKGGWALEPPELPANYVPKKWDELRQAVNDGRPHGYSFDQLIAQLLHDAAWRQCSQCNAGDCIHNAARSVLGLVSIQECAEQLQVRGEPLTREDLEHAKREVDASGMMPADRATKADECERCGKFIPQFERYTLQFRVGGETLAREPLCGPCLEALKREWAEKAEIRGKAAGIDGLRLKW